MKNRYFAWLLAGALCLTLLPAAALASDEPAAEPVVEAPAEPAEEAPAAAEEPAEEEPAPAEDAVSPIGDNELLAYESGSEEEYLHYTFDYEDDVWLWVTATAIDMTGMSAKWYKDTFDGSGSQTGHTEVTDSDVYELLVDESEDEIEFGLHIRSLTEVARYNCEVSDAYGNTKYIYFEVSIDSGLEAWAAGLNWHTTHYSGKYERNSTPVLKVEAEGLGPLTYRWYAWELEHADWGDYWAKTSTVLAEGDSFTAPPVTDQAQYSCIVTDRLGVYEEVVFDLRVDNHFEVEDVDWLLTAPLGQNVTMRVTATSDVPISYQWYTLTDTEEGWYYDREPIEGATGPSLTRKVESNAKYLCEVKSGSETISKQFNVEVDNGFTAFAKGTQEDDFEVHVAKGKTAAFEVEAKCREGGLTYQWYHEELVERDSWGDYYDYVKVEGATGPSLASVPVNEAEYYFCRVTDKYGTEREVYFRAYVEDGFSLTPVGSYTKTEEPHAPGVWTYSSVEVLCVYAKPGEAVTLEGKATGTDIEFFWWRYTDSEDFSKVEEPTGKLVRAGEAEDVYYLLSAENAYGESASLIFKIVSSGEGPAYDPLDANRDNVVDAKDAALFIRAKDPYSAALALKRAVGLT